MKTRVKFLAALVFSVAALFLVAENRAQAGLPDCYLCWNELQNCKYNCDSTSSNCYGNADEEYWTCINGGTDPGTCQATYNNAIWICQSINQDCNNRCGLRYNACCWL